MGKLIPKKDPKYDRSVDLDIVVSCGAEELFARMWNEVHPANVTLEERDPSGFSWSSVSIAKVKNLWARAQFEPLPVGLRVSTRITRAHTWSLVTFFDIHIGPYEVRGIDSYRQLTTAWHTALADVMVDPQARPAGPSLSAPPPPPPPPPGDRPAQPAP